MRSAELVDGIWRERPRPYYREGMWNTLRGELGKDCRVVVEIGTFLGNWAWNILYTFPEIDRLFCVDPWGGKKEEQVRSWCLRLGSDAFRRAFPLHGTSEFWGPKFDQPIDLLYVDGQHSYSAVALDLDLWAPKVRPGGIVLCHDYNVPQIKKAVDERLGNVIVENWGPHWGGKDSLSAWKKV